MDVAPTMLRTCSGCGARKDLASFPEDHFLCGMCCAAKADGGSPIPLEPRIPVINDIAESHTEMRRCMECAANRPVGGFRKDPYVCDVCWYQKAGWVKGEGPAPESPQPFRTCSVCQARREARFFPRDSWRCNNCFSKAERPLPEVDVTDSKLRRCEDCGQLKAPAAFPAGLFACGACCSARADGASPVPARPSPASPVAEGTRSEVRRCTECETLRPKSAFLKEPHVCDDCAYRKRQWVREPRPAADPSVETPSPAPAPFRECIDCGVAKEALYFPWESWRCNACFAKGGHDPAEGGDPPPPETPEVLRACVGCQERKGAAFFLEEEWLCGNCCSRRAGEGTPLATGPKDPTSHVTPTHMEIRRCAECGVLKPRGSFNKDHCMCDGCAYRKAKWTREEVTPQGTPVPESVFDPHALRQCLGCFESKEPQCFQLEDWYCNHCLSQGRRPLPEPAQEPDDSLECPSKTIRWCGQCLQAKAGTHFTQDPWACDPCAARLEEGRQQEAAQAAAEALAKEESAKCIAEKLMRRHHLPRPISISLAARHRNFLTSRPWFREKCLHAFASFDMDGSGFLDTTEVYAAVLKLYTIILPWVTTAQVPTAEEVLIVSDQIDEDKSGELNEQEFVDLLTVLCAHLGVRVLWEAIFLYVAAPVFVVVLSAVIAACVDWPDAVPGFLRGPLQSLFQMTMLSLLLCVAGPTVLDACLTGLDELGQAKARAKKD